MAIDSASDESDSTEFDTGRGSKVEVRELEELILITDTFGTIGFRRGKSRDIGS